MRPLFSVILCAVVVAPGLAAGLLAPMAPTLPPVPAGAPSSGCTPNRFFDVVALPVPISYNHWGDWDPHGRLFVLAEQELELLAQVGLSLAKAGLNTGLEVVNDPLDATDTLGLTGGQGFSNVGSTAPFDVSPLVQPLAIRAHIGDCVRVNFTNKLLEPASFHVHGVTEGPGQAMDLGGNGNDLAATGETRAYVMEIPDDPAAEGAHFVHSHGDSRYQTKHGLFGALVAEPRASSWRTPEGLPSLSGTQAIIEQPATADFREFVTIYHDEVELVDHHQNPLLIVSPYGEYGPGTKAVNLRTEPFMKRFDHHDQLVEEGVLARGHDKSQGYGSYTYGDPATFTPRSYVGEPTKWRLVNAGPGQPHVHHLHGGGDRWRVSPVADDTQFDDGLVKSNPVIQSASERVDVQLIGPGESFNAEIEGGAGGVQQAVGDFLYHCHIVEHYVAGMWSFWRVHNTRQFGLAELPDRRGLIASAVNSTLLLGRTMPDGTVLNATNLDDWVEPQLPAPGVAGEDDASTWDWTVNATALGPLYRGEPETDIAWANYASPTPGERPELQFDPVNGRLAYPFLSPHFGKRPPFAPGHGPAPYLGPTVAPGRADGLCPVGAPSRDYKVVAMTAAVPYNAHGDVDAKGQIFAHASDKAAIVAGTKPAKSFVIRANQGDCVDILLSSQLPDNAENGQHSKVNMHIHLVQFDPQASDGVISGFNYEQSVRPATRTGTTLSAPAGEGDTMVAVTSGAALRVGTQVGVGLTEPTVEVRTITAILGNTVTLDVPLSNAHAATERIGPEFVRYRWYADVNLGMVYWHDHVDGINAWRHGLFGGLVVEPNGSDWRDPKTGATVLDGHVVDIVGGNGTFREFVVQVQDRSACVPGRPGFNTCSGGIDLRPPNPHREVASFNLRSEPFHERNATYPLRSGVSNGTSTTNQGDPATDLWRAYPGDNVTIRLLYSGQSSTRAVATFAVTGHRFPFEQNLTGSRSIDAVSFGISSQHNLRLECGAGGCAELAGDYLYYLTQPDMFRRGAWGVFRVHDTAQSDLLELPTNEDWSAGSLPSGTERRYDVVALATNVTYNDAHNVTRATELFALANEESAILAGALRPTPLVLRALPGDVMKVNLTNRLGHPVTLSPALVEARPGDGLGIPIGANALDAVLPGANRTYTWVVDAAVGSTYLTSFGDPDDDALRGLYGALIVEPTGSSFTPTTGPHANVTLSTGAVVREHVLIYASDAPNFEASVMPYTIDLEGPVSVNYRSESLNDRVGPMGTHSCHSDNDTCTESLGGLKPIRTEERNPDNPGAFNSTLHGDPETPILDAAAGQRVFLRLVNGAGDQLLVHHVAGHSALRDPNLATSNRIDALTLGPREVATMDFVAGPGGPGDYYWGAHRDAFTEAGLWGLLRVQ